MRRPLCTRLEMIRRVATNSSIQDSQVVHFDIWRLNVAALSSLCVWVDDERMKSK